MNISGGTMRGLQLAGIINIARKNTWSTTIGICKYSRIAFFEDYS